MTTPTAFGVLLRDHRRARRLTQEELAGRTDSLHYRTISDLERGIRRQPHRGTIAELATALGLGDEDRVHFAAVARGQAAAEPAPAAGLAELPLPLSTFIGREVERAEVIRLLFAPATHRIVTITGPAGCGKSRVAIEAVRSVAEHYPDGVHLAELVSLTDPTRIPNALSIACGVRTPMDQATLPTLIGTLQERRVLLLVDNCEHLVAGLAHAISTILRACPGVQVLATSRRPLGIEGERVRPISPLPLPPLDADVDVLLAAPASRLYLDRAALAAGFVPTPANARAVAAICRQLDGLPLALELAALRAGTLTPADLAAQLRAGFQPLTRRAGLRHLVTKTLRAALDWSYDRLPADERRLLRRLAVFAGGCTLDAAIFVCGGSSGDGVREELVGLVDASLVQADRRETTSRYRLLETVRAYAFELLVQSGESEAIRARHLAWCNQLTTGITAPASDSAQWEWVKRLDGDGSPVQREIGGC